MRKVKRNNKQINITLPPEINQLLRELAVKTGHKMSKIVEKGIILFEKEIK